jgi:hypothetical protein
MYTQEWHEHMTDLNGDGASDRVLLNQGGEGLELSIGLSKNGGAQAPAASPGFMRKAIGAGVVSGLAKGENGELCWPMAVAGVATTPHPCCRAS